MNTDDTLCDEIEDATEDDTPYELWIINKKLKIKTVNTKQNTDKVTGTVSTVRTEADGIAEFETEFGVYLKKFVVGLHYQTKSRKTSCIRIPRHCCSRSYKRWFGF